MESILLVCLILLPIAAGVVLGCVKLRPRKLKLIVTAAVLALEAAGTVWILLLPEFRFSVFCMTPALSLTFCRDTAGCLFAAIAAFGFLLSGVYAFRYLEDDRREDTFLSFFLLSEGALFAVDFAGNLITMYCCFEAVTLLSMPLVLQDRTEEAIRGALKYLFYSIAGAFLALGCIFLIYRFLPDGEFRPGGTLDPAAAAGHETLLRVAVLLGVIGFGAKAGMYPLHGWLPTAHPVAPAPASAVLSGVIAKAGVLTILRLVYYVVGPAFLRGTWVQTVLLVLSLVTVFMGSMMAWRENVLKKRLAYSSVSQISYILTGLFTMTAGSVTGGLLHVIFHACCKICLFLCAGSFIHNLGKHRVDELKGLGKEMPVTLWSFTLAGLALIGIPPACGFVSKWYLAAGALESGLGAFEWVIPTVLLVSALLTAAYLLPVTVRGFFPGKDFVPGKRNPEGGWLMLLPVGLLAALTVLLGIFSAPLTRVFAALAEKLV